MLTTTQTMKLNRNLLKNLKFAQIVEGKCKFFHTTSLRNRIVHSQLPDVQLPQTHLFDFTWSQQNLGFYANHAALTDGLTGRSYTFLEASILAKKFAVSLAELGLDKNDVVCMVQPNCPEYASLVTGAAARGIVVSTANPTYTPGELARQFTASKTNCIVTCNLLLPNVKAALEKNGDTSSKVIVTDATDHESEQILSFQKLLAESGNHEKFDSISRIGDFDFESDPLLVPFSSGTTGLPKGVVLTHNNVVSNIRQCVHAEGVGCIQMPDGDSRASTLCVLPMFHAYGLFCTMFLPLYVAGHVISLPTFNPETFIKTLVKYRPRSLNLVPPLVDFCASHPAVKPKYLESVEFCMVGAAPLGVALFEKFHKKAPHIKIREGFGMTELSPMAMLTAFSKPVPGSCGMVLPNTEAKIADLNTGESLGPNERGELCIRGPQVMKEYLNNQEATKATVKDGNWLHTGDIAYFDDEEYFFIVDRLKELIKVKGFQVPPAELENVLRSHPKVADVAVIGIPDERTGEAPRAYLVTKEPMTEDEVQIFMEREVSEHKQLTGGVEFVEAILRSPSGKILRKDILANFLAAKQEGIASQN